MSVLDLFSKRQKRARGEVTEVYQYETIANPLRVQVVQIMADTLGDIHDEHLVGSAAFTYNSIVSALCREYGIFRLPPRDVRDSEPKGYELANFILTETDTERVLDAVELVCRVIDTGSRQFDYLYKEQPSEIADRALSEINARFLAAGVGFQFAAGELIRVDSQFLHAAVVKPTLGLLNAVEFAGAQQEFLSAHEHYRHGRTKEALNDALKAFESTLKAICDKRGWEYGDKATAKPLLDTVFAKELIPPFWQTHFGGVRSALEAGVPTVRNKLSGHGQGATPVEVPLHLVAFTLHMTATAILFLAEAEAALE